MGISRRFFRVFSLDETHDAGLEGRLVLFPHVRHFSQYLLVKIWQAKMHLSPLSSFWGQVQRAEASLPQTEASFIFYK